MKFNKLPAEIKWILIALAVLVVLFIGYYVWHKLTSIEDVASSNRAIEQANREIDVNQLTITDEQAETLADKFWNAIVGPGTDYEAIKDAISYCKTRSDVLKVAATYRILHGSSWLSSGTLWKDLTDDLDQNQIRDFNRILAYKNVEFTI